jgi:hypothetical protein
LNGKLASEQPFHIYSDPLIQLFCGFEYMTTGYFVLIWSGPVHIKQSELVGWLLPVDNQLAGPNALPI